MKTTPTIKDTAKKLLEGMQYYKDGKRGKEMLLPGMCVLLDCINISTEQNIEFRLLVTDLLAAYGHNRDHPFMLFKPFLLTPRIRFLKALISEKKYYYNFEK